MHSVVPPQGDSCSDNFQQVVDAYLVDEGLPFANALSAEQINEVCAKHQCLFGTGYIYNTAVVMWAFIGQALRQGKEGTCQSAVANIISFCILTQQDAPTSDTGDYCRARQKLNPDALRELTGIVARDVEERGDERWRFKERPAYLVDGFTFSMADTPENQQEFPQPKESKKGLGFPIARAVAIFSLATACLIDLAVGPYSGKETGESALLRTLLKSFVSGDIAVFDRCYCSFMMIALFQLQGVDVCAHLNKSRRSDFRRGRRLGKYDHIIVWTRPARPEWMDEATYEQIPKTLELREIRYNVVQKGCRTTTVTIVTTLTDAEQYSKEDLAQLYGFRWNSELDIRSIKRTLNLEFVDCKSPHMVRCHLWATMLGYNLIRATAAGAALLHHKLPRQISFTGTCQFVLAFSAITTDHLSADQLRAACECLARSIAACEVANRPGRWEPREIKRRRSTKYKYMKTPRKTQKKKILNS